MAEIEYWFTTSSPWSYLGHEPFLAVARKHGATIRYRPVRIGEVFAETGGLPLPRRHPARQRYRLFELQRWREKRGMPLNLQPKFFGADSTLGDCCVIALANDGADPGPFAAAIFSAKWAEDRDVGDDLVVADCLEAAGVERPDTIMAEAASDTVKAQYAANGREAIAASVFGAPMYVLGGEPFWGQDRLDMLDEALASGRAPYRVE